jgi:hypothetical protein
MKGTIGWSGTLSRPSAIVIAAPPAGGLTLCSVMGFSGDFESRDRDGRPGETGPLLSRFRRAH